MKFVDIQDKKLNRLNRNYCFAGTILIIAATFVCFYTVNGKCHIRTDDFHFYQLLASAFGHGDLGHIAGNMITLAFAGLFFERKHGTLAMLAAYPAMAILSCAAVILANGFHLFAWGASSAINAFYGIFFVCLLFDFSDMMKTKTDFVVHTLCFICFLTAMFIKIPGLTNWGEIFRDVHYPGFLVGALSALVYGPIKQMVERKNKSSGPQ